MVEGVAYYVLDTDAVIDILNGIESTEVFATQLLRRQSVLCTCDVILTEVFSGISPDGQERAKIFLNTLMFLPSTPEIGERAGTWRYLLARQGITITSMDAIIAATALAWGATLITGNIRHFPMTEVTVLPLPRVAR